jgi:hypothetical protein
LFLELDAQAQDSAVQGYITLEFVVSAAVGIILVHSPKAAKNPTKD